MKIFVCVQSCKRELFTKSAKFLTSSYRRISTYLNLPLKSYYFTGTGSDMNYINGDEIMLAGSDTDTSEKAYHLFETILYANFMNFNVLVRTNTSTVTNIKKLYEFLCSDEYDRNTAYCGGLVNHWRTDAPDIIYPNGNFYIFSREICTTLFTNWLESRNKVKELYNISDDFGKNDSNIQWTGVPEDLLTGFILKENNIPVKRIWNFLNFRDTVSENIDYIGPDIYDYIGIYAKTHLTDLKSRTAIEPGIIEFLSLMFESHACNRSYSNPEQT